ncbi:hypothetical protein L2K20_10750 [Mycobacterium sp. MBM]|nr:hypothetical protein [Mycobacterium sp. MBM]
MLSRSHLVAAAVFTVAVSACTPAEQGGVTGSAPAPTLPAFTTSSTTSTTAAAQDADYRDLLLTAGDLTDADDTFVERSREPAPDGHPGASAFFVNEHDTRAIIDTVLIYPDAEAAAAALQQAVSTRKVVGDPEPTGVGQGGVVIRGSRPSEDKAVTLLLFTEGPALVRIEFQSADGDVTTDRFVTSIGKMQQIALRVGLADPQQ